MKSASSFRRFPASKPVPASSRRTRKRFRARLEGLEDRIVLSTLDPNAFTSLGTLSTTNGNSYTINTDTLSLSGPGTSFTGVSSGGIAVFDFDSVTIAAGSTITATGSIPLAILSQSSITIDGTVDGSGQDAVFQSSPPTTPGGPGGYGGGHWASSTQQPGQGPGGGGASPSGTTGSYYGGGGGGFGGAGGGGGDSGGAGGSTYGDLLTQLVGGSGGATGIALNSGGTYGTSGGGGGGAMELVAVNSLVIDAGGVVQADGGSGNGAAYGGSGAGSGGGIILQASTVTNDGTVSAVGGNGGGGGCCGGGGGGGGGILDVLYRTQQDGTGTYDVAGGSGGSGSSPASGDGTSGVVQYQTLPDITVSLSGTEVLLTGDSIVTILGAVYAPATETYTFTANAGMTFEADSSVPATLTFTSSGNTATLAPNGTTWASLGYSVGTDMTATTGTAITLGGVSAPASNFGTGFDVANASGGTTALTVDDSDDTTTPLTVEITDTSLSLGQAPAITYGGATLSGLTVNGSDVGGTWIDVSGTPAATAPLSLAMGSGGTNTIDLGSSPGYAFALGDVTITSAGSATDLTIDDGNDPNGQAIGMTGSTVSFTGGPTFDISQASLDDLVLGASGHGSNVVTVTSVPDAVVPTLAIGAGSANAVTIGDSVNFAGDATNLAGLTITGKTALTIDDQADPYNNGVTVTSTQVVFPGEAGPFDYSAATLASLTFEGGMTGQEVDVQSMPAGVPLTLSMGANGTNPIILGQFTGKASSLGPITITSAGSLSDLSIDDSNDSTAGQTVYIDSGTMKAGPTLWVSYSGAVLSSFTYTAGDDGTNLTVHRSPTSPGPTLAPMTLDMGSSPANTVQLGSSEADTLGDVTLIGDMGLTVNDSNGSNSWTIGVTATTIGFSSGASSNTFDYSQATLSSLSLATDNAGGNIVNVTGTPALPTGVALSIGTFAGSDNAYNLGDSTHAASLLGDISLSPSGDGTTTLTVNDLAGAGGGTITVQSSSLDFGAGGPTFTYDGASFAGVTVNASNSAATTVNVLSVPSAPIGLAPLTLNMGGQLGNAVNLGDSSDAASGLGDVTVTTTGTPPNNGATSLKVNDSDGAGAEKIMVGVTSLDFSGGPTFNYGGADLAGLTFDASSVGGNEITVTGSPQLIAFNTVIDDTAPAQDPDIIQIGDAGAAFSTLAGDVWIQGAGAASLTIDDSASENPTAYLMDGAELSSGTAPVVFYSDATGLTALTVKGSSEGDTWNVTGTIPGGPTTIITSPAGGDTDTVTLGGSSAGTAASTLGDVVLHNGGAGFVALTIDDSAGDTGQAITVGTTVLSFAGGPSFTYGLVYLAGLTLDASSAGSNDITVNGSPKVIGGDITIDDAAPSDAPDSIMIGDASSPASGTEVDVTIAGSGSTSLTIDDSASTASASYLLQVGQFTIGAVPVIAFGTATGLTGLTLEGSSGGDTWDLAGSPGCVTTITTHPAILPTIPPIVRSDSVTVDGTALKEFSGDVNVEGGGAGTTSLTINDASTATPTSPLLEFNPTTGLSDLSGICASTFAFNAGVANVSLVPSSVPGITTTLTVNFTNGNPLPIGAATSFGFQGNLGASNSLVLQGELPLATPFDSEVYSPMPGAPGSGTIGFTLASSTSTLIFGGLTPIDDTVPATSYTFVAPSTASLVEMSNGPSIGAFVTDTISSGDTPSAFELVNFANKANVLVNLTAIANPTYITPPTIPATGLVSLTVSYFGANSSGQTLTIDGTTPGMVNTIQLGGSNNTIVVQSVTAGGPLTILNQPGALGAVNSVSIGDAGSLADIEADVTIEGPAQSVNVSVNGSAETTPFGSMLLERNLAGSLAVLTGVLPGAELDYDPTAIRSFSLSTGSGADHLAVDFVNGNPFAGPGVGSPPPAPYTLGYNGGGGGDSLAFQDSSASTGPIFDSETYLATGPNSGNVSFDDGTSPSTMVYQGGVDFSQLTPTIDSTPVTDYTFTAPTSGGTIAVTDDPTAGYTLISDPSPSPSFESVAYSNKTDVTIDATHVRRNNLFILNNPVAASGQTTLTVDLGSGTDTLTVAANPAGVTTAIDGGVGSQAMTVAGAGLAAGTTWSNFMILGGTGPDVMRLDAQGTGSTATLTPGTASSPAVATFGSGPGSTSMAFLNIGTIQEFATNHAPSLAMPSPLPTIPAQPGLPLVNVPVATFQDQDLIENAASFVATIDWGDGSAPTTGTVTAVPAAPGHYVISGSHTYLASGPATISVTLTDMGGTFTSTLNNAGGAVVPVSTQLDGISPVTGSTAQVSVAALHLGSTTALAATAGTSASGELAVFINANGPAAPGAYTALINWGDGTGLGGAAITADPSVSGAFDIGGTHTYAAAGTYSGSIDLYAVGTGQSLVIPLSANVQSPSVKATTGLTGSNNVPTGPLTVATVSVPSFLNSPGLDYRHYAASVDYGDGSPTVPATLAPTSVLGVPGVHGLDQRPHLRDARQLHAERRDPRRGRCDRRHRFGHRRHRRPAGPPGPAGPAGPAVVHLGPAQPAERFGRQQ